MYVVAAAWAPASGFCHRRGARGSRTRLHLSPCPAPHPAAPLHRPALLLGWTPGLCAVRGHRERSRCECPLVGSVGQHCRGNTSERAQRLSPGSVTERCPRAAAPVSAPAALLENPAPVSGTSRLHPLKQMPPPEVRSVVTFLCPVDPAVPKLTKIFSTDLSTVQEEN